MAAAQLILLLLGILVNRRLLARAAWYDGLGSAFALGLFALLLGVNGGLRAGLEMGWSLLLTLGALTLVCALLWLRGPRPEAAPHPGVPAGVLAALVAILLLAVYQVQQQRTLELEPAYAASVTTQGVLTFGLSEVASGSSSETLNLVRAGEYGPELLVATWARLTNSDVFSAQGDLVVLAVLGTLLGLFGTARRCSGSSLTALLCTAVCAFGLGPAVGEGIVALDSSREWLGLFAFVLLLDSTVELQLRPSRSSAFLLGGAVAISALFSPSFLLLAVLALPVLGASATKLGPTDSAPFRFWAGASVVAILLALTQTDPLALRSATSGWLEQSVPTTERHSWVALFSPLWLALLIRLKSPAVVGGALSALVGLLLPPGPVGQPWPAVLNATALWMLGLGIGGLLLKPGGEIGRLGALRRHRLELTRSGIGAGLALLLLGAALAHEARVLNRLLADQRERVPLESAARTTLTRGELWLAQHPQLLFDPLDLEATAWLRHRVVSGERILVAPTDDPLSPLLFDSTFTALTGVPPAGRESPAAEELSRRFWETRSPEALKTLAPDWLYYRDDQGVEPAAFPAATLARRFRQGDKLRLLYRVESALLSGAPTSLESPSEAPSQGVSGTPRPEEMP